MPNPELEALWRRIQALEEQLQGLQQHGFQHQLGGDDEILVTQALRIMGDPSVGATVTGGHLKLLNRAVPTEEGWIKLNETGDVYINAPSTSDWVVLRFNNASYKVSLTHDGTSGHIRSSTGSLILQSGVNADVEIGEPAYAVNLRIPGAGAFKSAKTHSIPYYIWSDATSGGNPAFPDENAGNRIRIWIPTPDNWDGSTDITIKTIWYSPAAGLVDLESYIDYRTETNEMVEVLVQGWTDQNLTWVSGTSNKTLTTTIAAANIATGRYFGVFFRRNTGDAHSDIVRLRDVKVTTKLLF